MMAKTDSTAPVTTKRQFSDTAAGLRARERALDADLAHWVASRRRARTADAEEHEWLPKESGKGENLVTELESKFRDDIRDSRSMLQTVMDQLQKAGDGSGVGADVEDLFQRFETRLAQLQSELHDGLQRALVQERLLTQELDLLANRMAAWHLRPADDAVPAPTNPGKRGVARRLAPPSGTRLAPEVEDYNRFIDKHGALGGWDPASHDLVIQMLGALRRTGRIGLQKLAQCASLVGRSPDEVNAHLAWMDDHDRLLERKRQAVVAWRQAKVAVEPKVEQVEPALMTKTAPKPADDPEHERKLAELAAWREKKQRQEQEERRQREREERERHERDREAMLRKQLRLKKALEERRQAAKLDRPASTDLLALDPPSLAPEVQERINARSQALIERRRLLAAKSQQQHTPPSVPVRLVATAERDPARLLAPTQASQRRAEEAVRQQDLEIRSAASAFQVTQATMRGLAPTTTDADTFRLGRDLSASAAVARLTFLRAAAQTYTATSPAVAAYLARQLVDLAGADQANVALAADSALSKGICTNKPSRHPVSAAPGIKSAGPASKTATATPVKTVPARSALATPAKTAPGRPASATPAKAGATRLASVTPGRPGSSASSRSATASPALAMTGASSSKKSATSKKKNTLRGLLKAQQKNEEASKPKTLTDFLTSL
ncbi:hypothetical protein GGF32_004712 [Allomyces javanicus]|nr:hypothetical protein GGF32_004712 [Allomyces javanicus]